MHVQVGGWPGRAGWLARRWRRSALALAVVAVVACAAPSGEAGSGTADRGTDPALEDLRRAVLATPPGEEIPAEPLARVERLPPERRLKVALSLAAGEDPRLLLLGGSLLLELGEEAEADRAFAAGVLQGADLTGLFFGWLHGTRPDLPMRRFVGISRALLNRYETLDPGERARADRFLCDESLGVPLDGCTQESVRERLQRLEAELEPPPLEED